MEEAVIVSGVRTPFGAFGGSLAEVPATTLGSIVVREALGRAGLTGDQVDEVIMGNVIAAGLGENPARQAAVHGGVGIATPAVTINKVCGSGMKAIALASQAIRLGEAEVVVAGGFESMSRAPYLLTKARFGYRMGDATLEDSLMRDGLLCAFENCHMGVTAENVAKDYGIARAAMDEFAAASQAKAARAMRAGRFQREIVPVPVPQRRGDPVSVATDEHPRPDTTVEKLATLSPVFAGAQDGTVTAGNASGINDGAAAVVVTSRRWAAAQGLQPLGRIVAFASAGVEPRVMGIGPIPATRKVLERAGLALKDIDLIELNEAFAAQALAVGNTLGWDWDRVNVNGGAIALGHPVGASGARIVLTLLYELAERGGRYGLATMCCGGGMGVAMVVERVA